MAAPDKEKKQVPLRLSPKLYDALAAWAEDDFRSVNGQIEYLLTECVRQRKKKTLVGSNGETMDVSALSEMLCSLDDNILRADLTLVHDRLSADLYVKDPNRSAANAVEQYNQMVLRHERIEYMNIIPDSLDKRLK